MKEETKLRMKEAAFYIIGLTFHYALMTLDAIFTACESVWEFMNYQP
jgi:hypothetical protein